MLLSAHLSTEIITSVQPHSLFPSLPLLIFSVSLFPPSLFLSPSSHHSLSSHCLSAVCSFSFSLSLTLFSSHFLSTLPLPFPPLPSSPSFSSLLVFLSLLPFLFSISFLFALSFLSSFSHSSFSSLSLLLFPSLLTATYISISLN